MGKKELATLVDAYADAKASGNKYLVQSMIVQLEGALNEIFGDEPEAQEAQEQFTSEEY